MLSQLSEFYRRGLKQAMSDYGVTQGIMMFIVAAVMLIVLLPVLNGVMTATPAIPVYTNATDSNTSLWVYQGARAAAMNSSQGVLASTIGSSYGLLLVVLILISAAVVIGAIGLFKYFGGND